MTRVLVVSSQTMIALSLQDEFEVTAVHPGDLEPTVIERGYDVTVLDAADVEATVLLLSELPRTSTGPILLLAHDQSSALALDLAKGLSDIRIGPPISGPHLRERLHGIADVPISADVDRPGQTEPVRPHHDQGELERRLRGRRTEPSTLERAGTPADLLSLSQGLSVLATPPIGPDGPPRPPAREQVTTASLVAALLERVPSLLEVDAVAAAMADDACQRAEADAAAILLNEDGRYVLAAGMGLGPLEHRLELDSDHWLVREVVRAGHGLIVEDTDIARLRLMGAPLSDSQHLLVVPITDVGAMVMVARDAEGVAFTSTDLAAVTRLTAEAAGPLREVLQLRELGRRLAGLDSN